LIKQLFKFISCSCFKKSFHCNSIIDISKNFLFPWCLDLWVFY